MSERGWGFLAGVVVIAGLAGGAGSIAVQRIGGGDVRGYLLAHPELIPEAMQRLQDRETGKTIAANRNAILEPYGSAWAGNPKGDLTIAEYFDYNCGYCRASLPVIAKLLAGDPKLRIVYRDFPVLAPSSDDAAKMSLAAAEQGRFQAFHDALYASGPVSGATIAHAAQVAGVDPARAAAFAPKVEAQISSNIQTARALGMTGTPGWVIGDRVVSSAMPIEELQRLIAVARAR